jgi:cytidylate kinase
MTIVNLRGCNGSGKSTIARALFQGEDYHEVDLAPYHTPNGAPRNVRGYWVPSRSLIVVGPYTTDCGGCDAVKTQDLVCESIRMAAVRARNVFFEGVIVSTIYHRYHALSQELGGMVWAYLDTPLEVCLARIQVRNGGKEIKEHRVAEKVSSIIRTRERAEVAGERTVCVPYSDDPVAQLSGMFN